MTAPAAITRPLASGKRRQGIVVFFNRTRHYGFIRESNRDVFFNGQHVAGGHVPSEGDRVSFIERNWRDGRPCARDVQLIRAAQS
jgi:cold shock CspA family protein